MDEQKNTQSHKPVQQVKNVWIIIICVAVTTFIASGLFYWWHHQQLKSYEAEIKSLKSELETKEINETIFQERIEKLKEQVKETAAGDTQISSQPPPHVFGGMYINDQYNFSFEIPSTWVFRREEKNVGGDPLRVYLTVPGFKEKVLPESEDILSISVSNNTFENEYHYMDASVGKESEKKVMVAGREAFKRIGTHEFGGYLVVVVVPNGNNAISLILRTNEEPYVSEFEGLLKSFRFGVI